MSAKMKRAFVIFAERIAVAQWIVFSAILPHFLRK
jgi:hypothetical protein